MDLSMEKMTVCGDVKTEGVKIKNKKRKNQQDKEEGKWMEV